MTEPRDLGCYAQIDSMTATISSCQRLVQPPQLPEFDFVREVETRPALPENEPVRVFGDLRWGETRHGLTPWVTL